MSTEGTISWELLKNLATALDSYRIRALIDAKQDVLEAGIYDELQYDNLLLNMLEEEKLKFSLYVYLRENTGINLEGLKLFSNENSVDFYKVLSVFELLKNEKLIIVDELYDTIKGDEDKPDKHIFKDFSINISSSFLNNFQRNVTRVYIDNTYYMVGCICGKQNSFTIRCPGRKEIKSLVFGKMHEVETIIINYCQFLAT